MPIENVDSWAQFGLGGMVIAALFALLLFLMREHKIERQEWISAYKESVATLDQRQAETNAVIRSLVSAMEAQSNAIRR